jgi:hypothetical protein
MMRHSSLFDPPLAFLDPCLPNPGAGAFLPTIVFLPVVADVEEVLSLVKVCSTVPGVDELSDLEPLPDLPATSMLDKSLFVRFFPVGVFSSSKPAASDLRLTAEFG